MDEPTIWKPAGLKPRIVLLFSPVGYRSAGSFSAATMMLSRATDVVRRREASNNLGPGTDPVR
jgi:hypothetical protein